MDRVQVTGPFVGICHMQVCAVKDATDSPSASASWTSGEMTEIRDRFAGLQKAQRIADSASANIPSTSEKNFEGGEFHFERCTFGTLESTFGCKFAGCHREF